MEKLNKVLYETSATAVDGREGHVKSESGRLDFTLSKPEGMGGGGEDRANPEELFAAGYAACFGGAIEHVAKERGVDVGSPQVKAQVQFGLNDSGVGLAVQITGKMENVNDETALDIMNEAHEKVCPYSKATRGNIEVTIGLM